MTDNLALWDQVSKTDPVHTKPITGKAYSGTSPRPYYLIRRATETFGPIGIGWGFTVVEEQLLDGALIEPGFFEKVHTARVRLWFNWNGQRGEFEHVGQTVFCGRRKPKKEGEKGIPFTDEDAPKKSVTDAIVKALSMLGFAGDIFMGRYDDSKYVAETRAEFAEKANGHDGDQLASVVEYMRRAQLHIAEETDITALKRWWHEQGQMRIAVGVVNGTPEYPVLFNAFKARGEELARASIRTAPPNSRAPEFDDSIPF